MVNLKQLWQRLTVRTQVTKSDVSIAVHMHTWKDNFPIHSPSILQICGRYCECGQMQEFRGPMYGWVDIQLKWTPELFAEWETSQKPSENFELFHARLREQMMRKFQ